jgi:peroxiredoxin
MNKIVKVILVIMLVGLLITGCTHTQGTEVGNLAPDFQYQNSDGQSTYLSDLRGRPVLINFWQVRCPPCRMEMPYIQQVYNGWSGKGLVFLAINIGESPSLVEEFMQNQGLSLPVLLDMGGNVAKKYNIQYIPSSFFIDKDGIIQNVKVGPFSSVEEIEEGLSKVIP